MATNRRWNEPTIPYKWDSNERRYAQDMIEAMDAVYAALAKKGGGGEPYDDTQLRKMIAQKANIQHTHSFNDLDDKPTIPPPYDDTAVRNLIRGKANAVHRHDYADLDNTPTIPEAYDDSAIRQLISGKANSVHQHSYADITDPPTIPVVPDALPNPYPLTINGTVYNGSEAKEITIQGGGAQQIDLIWSGSQTISSTFTFDTDITQYKFLILKYGSTYASTIMLAVGGVAFGGIYTTSSNTSRMYFLMGTCAWTSNSLKMAWTFRFYKTSATAGGSSTLDPAVTEIYGIK